MSDSSSSSSLSQNFLDKSNLKKALDDIIQKCVDTESITVSTMKTNIQFTMALHQYGAVYDPEPVKHQQFFYHETNTDTEPSDFSRAFNHNYLIGSAGTTTFKNPIIFCNDHPKE